MSLNNLPRTADRQSWEGSPLPRFFPWLTAAALMIAAGVLLGFVVREFDDIQAMFMEDGPIETLQALVLAIAAIIFALAFLKSTGGRAAFCAVAAFAIVFAVTRELPRCGSVYTGGGVCLPAGGKTSVVLCAAALGLIALLWRRREWSTEVLRLTNLRWLWPCFVVVVMLAGAEAAEHRVHVEIEESLELVAYLYLVAYGAWILRHTSGPTLLPPLGETQGAPRTAPRPR